MANRTPLFNRVQPGGVFTIADVVAHPGSVWWVDSVTGTNGAGYGRNPDAPTATIDYAYNLADESKGDVIYVLPGHEETLMDATGLVLDKAGINIIGLGRGKARPIINFGHTTSQVIVSAANQRVSNLILNATVTGVVLGVSLVATGNDFELDNCYITWETTASEFTAAVGIVSCARVNIHDNVFDTEEASGAASAISLDDADDAIIARNIFSGFWTAAPILGAAFLSARVLIIDNVIYNSVTTAYNGIDAGALNSTGIVARNAITALYTTNLHVMRSSNLTFHRNTVANAIRERATILWPATTSA